ncbi:hypothetical protein GCM10025871_15120 [Deinococcus metallilatus]|nr:hypothetical protein GCM10025871_15120 [Deinococcus metallilatus]
MRPMTAPAHRSTLTPRALFLLAALSTALSACGSGPSPAATAPGSPLLQPLSIDPGDNTLSYETPVSATNGWGPYENNMSNGEKAAGDGRTLTLNGTTYATGLGVHANSDLVYNVGAQCRTFTAQIGVDDEVGANGSVVFQVFVDGVKRFDSGRMDGSSATQAVNVDIEGAERLRLVVTDAGDGISYDHADWADAKLRNCLTYSAPLTITAGGTYSGNWRSLDPNVPAVKVATSAPVVIENCTLSSRNDSVKVSSGNAQVTIRNCRAYGLNPNVSGQFPGRFFRGDYLKSLRIENNFLNKTAGISTQYFQGSPSVAGETITIRYNRVRNIEGRASDGADGWQSTNAAGTFDRVQFVQFNNVDNIQGAEIAWNRVDNEPRNSRVEDNINIYDSNGTATSPILIHDNLINGAYATPPDGDYSGGGILLGDGCHVSYVEAYGNTVLETSNYGMAVANGHHMTIRNNTIYGLGKLSDGTYLDQNNDAGIYLRNYCSSDTIDRTTVVARDNTVGWGTPSPGNERARWDISNNAGTTLNNTSVPLGQSTPIDPNLIQQAITDWQNRAASNGVVVGPR